jgi:hypothetical protein
MFRRLLRKKTRLCNIAEIKLLLKLGKSQQIISLQKFHENFDVASEFTIGF